MTDPALRPAYTILPVDAEFGPGDASGPWPGIPSLGIDHYLWLENGYRPPVEVKLCYSRSFLHVRFRVGERRVRVKYLKFQDPVYKDSCVEFFIDAFPESRLGYVNFETNAAGTLLAAFGPDRFNRKPLWPEDLGGFDVSASVAGPLDGEHGGDTWTLEYRVPLALFRKIYALEVRPGHRAAANFYKCGDETEFPHYGAWSRIDTPSPDFHRPDFFGEVIFGQ